MLLCLGISVLLFPMGLYWFAYCLESIYPTCNWLFSDTNNLLKNMGTTIYQFTLTNAFLYLGILFSIYVFVYYLCSILKTGKVKNKFLFFSKIICYMGIIVGIVKIVNCSVGIDENVSYATFVTALSTFTFCFLYLVVIVLLHKKMKHTFCLVHHNVYKKVTLYIYICSVYTFMFVSLIDRWIFFRLFHVGQWDCPWIGETWYYYVSKRITTPESWYYILAAIACWTIPFVYSLSMCVIAYKKKSNLQGVLFILKKFSFTLLLIVIVRFIGDTTNIHIMSDYYYMNSVPTFVLFLGLIVSFRWYFSTITTMRKNASNNKRDQAGFCKRNL